jgi:hypothetical protein
MARGSPGARRAAVGCSAGHLLSDLALKGGVGEEQWVAFAVNAGTVHRSERKVPGTDASATYMQRLRLNVRRLPRPRHAAHPMAGLERAERLHEVFAVVRRRGALCPWCGLDPECALQERAKSTLGLLLG